MSSEYEKPREKERLRTQTKKIRTDYTWLQCLISVLSSMENISIISLRNILSTSILLIFSWYY